MRKREKTIIRMFIIPLALVMLIQAIAAYGALWLGGTSARLEDYSVGIMEQIVRNRNLILGNSMIHRWSDVSSEAQLANSKLARILTESGLDETDFLDRDGVKQELLEDMLVPCISMLRRNGVNGVYLVLADGQGQTDESVLAADGRNRCSGIYFRDMDAYVNPKDYSDLLMVRGDYGFSHKLKIPFDTVWTAKFNLNDAGVSSCDNFFYNPYMAATKNPDVSAEKLGYWSKLFCLEDDTVQDGHQMIAYSIPLITESGFVYGVLGVEVSMYALDGLLPEGELNLGQQSGYMLAEYDKNGRIVPFYAKGAAVKRNVELGTPLSLNATKYPDLYKINGAEENAQAFYADIVPFSMYNPNTPFEENGWALLGVQDEAGLFGMGQHIMRNVLFVIALSLFLGFLCIFILMKHLTKPISQLDYWIRNLKRGTLHDYRKTNISEIDNLYEAVHDMTEKQKKAEYAVREEKERYLMALQSSTDIIFTYDVVNDSMDILNLALKGENEIVIPNLRKSLGEEKAVHEVDRQVLERAFIRLDDKFKLQFRYRYIQKGWQWMEISGKTICDESGNKVKVVGNIRNINAQKLKEQMKNKATRIDMVTGLYLDTIGQSIITSEIEMGRTGYLAFLDLDKFKELNEQYGIDFGDAILEELGSFILKLKREFEKNGRRVVAVRAGGDEIDIWFRGLTWEDAESFFTRFYRLVDQLCQNGKFDFSITAVALSVNGVVTDYQSLINRLGAAMFYCKKRLSGEFTNCADIPEQELLAENGEKRGYNEIASAGSTRNMNAVTKAFNLFERGNRVAPVIAVLFAKMGETYNVRDIIMTEIRWDFNTSSVFSEWHAHEDAPQDPQICYFKEEELSACSDKLLPGNVYFGKDDIFTERDRSILHIPSGFPGLCIPLYDSRKLMGVLFFIQNEMQPPLSEDVCGELQEITRIIETNVNRERYDLASRAKSDFLSRMSHEIRTPMNAIVGMATIALGKQEEPQQVEACLHKINQSSQYLLSLINDILDMSKIESGKMKLSLVNGSIKEFAREISDLMEDQFQDKQIGFVQEIDVDREWVIADFMRLKQVIINLMGNAVKFTPPGGKVIFTVEEKTRCDLDSVNKTEFYFAVSDTGIGISPENQERIFNAFEQAENMTAAVYGGTGLGLSISGRLIRLMGGDIGLESEEGQGSRFFFTLKLQMTEPQEIEKKSMMAMERQDFTDCRVLLVEDNELNTEIAKTLLEMHDFKVETASNGLEGLIKFRDSAPCYYDLILMDIRMPMMDGLEATKAIRRLKKEDAGSVPIIAMTANAFDEDMKRSIESGMNGHLAKPIDVKELLQTAGRVMGKNSNVEKM